MSLTIVSLRDEFDIPVAAGSVNNTLATDGTVRAVGNNPENQDSISSGELILAAKSTPAIGSPTLYWASYARVAGLVFRVNVKRAGPSMFGWAATVPVTSGTHMQNGIISYTTTPYIYNGATGPIVAAATVNLYYQWFFALRSVGCQYFVKGGTEYTYPLLVWIDAVKNSTPLYPVVANMNATGSSQYADARVGGYFLASPLVSDGFGSAFGTSDGLGHAETSGIGSGGSGVAWTQRVGTWTVSGGKAQANALSGGIAIATAASSTTDQLVGLDITRSAGEIGVVLRYTDASNYIRAIHNGTNLQVIKKVAGTDTTIINAAATYSAGKKIWIWPNGSSVRAYFNDALIGSATISDSVLQSGVVGIYTSDTGNTGDNFVAYAVGTSGEYATAFDISIPATGSSAGVGDSSAGATRKRTANGSSAGVGDSSAGSTRKRTANGSSAGVGSASGAGRANRLANGAAIGSGSASGTIRVNRRVAGQSAGGSTASASSSRKRLISGASAGNNAAVVHNYTTEATIYSS